MTTPSVVVIGAGAAGMNAALQLAELGCTDVTVLERKHVASGSTALSAGVFNINGTDPVTVELRVAARNLLDIYEAEDGLHLARNGHLRLGRKERHVAMFEETVAQHRELGVSDPSVLLSPDEIARLAPEVVLDDVIAGMYNARDGHMDGPLLCGVLADRARTHGVEIVTNSPVLEATRAGGRHRVRTPDATYEADVVINAAGAWADRVGELLGAPLPLVNQVHDVVKVKLPAARAAALPMVQEYNPGDEEAIYVRQDGPDSLIGGEHTYVILDKLDPADPDDYRQTVPWEVWESVAKRISARLNIEGLGFEPGWTGLYPLSADSEFVVGPYEHDASIVAFGGLGGAGVNSGVGLGRVVAEWILHGEPRSIPGAARMLPDRPSLLGAAPAGA
jgi:glycine/D-amino acid oxidase-like deaminating enzyme